MAQTCLAGAAVMAPRNGKSPMAIWKSFPARAALRARRTSAIANCTWTVQTLTVVATCGSITVYRNTQGQLVAPGWVGTIKLGTNGNNTIAGGSGRDLLLGLGGNDRLDGKAGDDLICGGAALVALPLDLRRRYIAKVQELLPVGAQQFVNTLEYAPLLPEPSFSITPAEVAAYYGETHQIQHLEAPLLPEHGMVRKFGLSYLKEHGFLLTKQGLGCGA